MAGFKSLLISFLLVGVFFLAMINFGVQIATDNNATQSINDNEVINFTSTNLTNQFTKDQTSANLSKQSFEEQSVTEPTGALIFPSIVNAGKTFGSIFTNMFLLFNIVFIRILGVPAILITVLSTILMITIVFSLWRVYKSGE